MSGITKLKYELISVWENIKTIEMDRVINVLLDDEPMTAEKCSTIIDAYNKRLEAQERIEELRGSQE